MYKRFPLPKRFWIYFTFIFILSILLLGNFFRTDSWTGDKPFSEFVQRDWELFFIFLIEELIIVAVMFLFAFLANRVCNKRNAEITARWKKEKLSGITSDDYDYLWFDFDNTERAVILKCDDLYKLNVQEYDEQTRNWENVGGVSFHESLESVKKALYYDCDFFCEENAELDKHGNEIYKET